MLFWQPCGLMRLHLSKASLSLSFSLSLSVSLQYLISKSVIPVALGKDFLKVFLSFAETNFVPGSRIRFISMPHISWVEKEKEMPLLQSLPDAACNSNRVINKDCVS
jgi:hypothetical protein